jgi:hypothetical protein
MNTNQVLKQIDDITDRLNRLRKAVTSTQAPTASKKPTAKTKQKQTRVLSPEARKRIADAQKRRWAKQRRATK